MVEVSVVVVVNDPDEGQAAVPKEHREGVLAMMPAGGKQEWSCGNGCYGFVLDFHTVWVIETECADIKRLPRELVREAMYR